MVDGRHLSGAFAEGLGELHQGEVAALACGIIILGDRLNISVGVKGHGGVLSGRSHMPCASL